MIDKLGLTEKSPIDKEQKLRKETDLKSQRPEAKTESISSDRGTFKNKC